MSHSIRNIRSDKIARVEGTGAIDVEIDGNVVNHVHVNILEGPRLVEKILETIRQLRDDGKTFLIVSHDLHSVAAICTRVIALNFGEVIAEGTPDEIRNNKEVIDIYLGA